MSLDRFTNRVQLIENHVSDKGDTLPDNVLEAMSYEVASIGNVSDVTSITKQDIVTVESHIYNFRGKYISSIYETPYKFETKNDHFYINYSQLFNEAGIRNGNYKVSSSFLINLIGSNTLKFYSLKDISSDGTELHFQLKNIASEDKRQEHSFAMTEFNSILASLKQKELLNMLCVNFGNNNIYTIINIAISDDLSSMFCKIAQPLIVGTVKEFDGGYISLKVLDDHVNSVIVEIKEPSNTSNKLKGPKFDLDIPESSGTTVARSWDALLDVQAPTATKLIGEILSGSRSIPLNIDYSNYSKFVIYGQAEDRVKNFDYKLELIEHYTSQSNDLTDSNIGNIAASITNKLRYNNRISSIQNNFDDFEKYLYYDTGSVFTHGDEGDQLPAPKDITQEYNIVNSRLYPRSSSMYVDWYSSSVNYAQAYDRSNYDSLYWQTPDHILRDPNNDQYILFLSMIGQHFDNLYTYIRELTSIHQRDEHPKRGIPNKLLPIYAESLGWILQDTNQLSNLWLYKLGVNNSGSYATPTGSLASAAHEHLSNQIWRRIVNNLPYILKTKGSDRAVKALISSYGIPQTLVSIKEYGGPRVEDAKPNFIENRFAYILNFNSDQYIELPRRLVSSSISNTPQVPQTVEFRFRTKQTGSTDMSLWAIEDGNDRDNVLHNLEIIHFTADTTGSFGHYSGSRDYGYLKYTGTSYLDGVITELPSVSSSALPLFDDDIWSVRIYSTNAIYDGSDFDGNIHIDVQKASNSTDKRISVSSSMTFSHDNPSELYYTLGATGSITNTSHKIVIGGTTGSSCNRFSGSIHGYKEYFENYPKSVFDEHTLNPGAYHSSTYSSSYDTLFRYYPLGLDNIRFDHSTVTEISSSHPNRKLMTDTSASLFNFTQAEAKQYDSLQETYYTYVPSIGASNLKSERIRIDPSSTRYELSPTRRSEISLHDRAQQDSNRLAIVFSPTDQVNRDIINNFGFLDFDDMLGNPQDTKTPYYKTLRPLQYDYWKKYTADNNFNEFIRIFGLYDYTLFEQIKQLIPARANYIGGVLLENNILGRSRIVRKYPTLSRLDLEGNIIIEDGDIGICYNYISSSIDMPDGIDIVYNFTSSSIDIPNDVDIAYKYISGSIITSNDLDITYVYHTSSIVLDQSNPTIRYSYNSGSISLSNLSLNRGLPKEGSTVATIDPGILDLFNNVSLLNSNVNKYHQDRSTFLEDGIDIDDVSYISSGEVLSHFQTDEETVCTPLEDDIDIDDISYISSGEVLSHFQTDEETICTPLGDDIDVNNISFITSGDILSHSQINEEIVYSFKDSSGVTQSVTGSFKKAMANEGTLDSIEEGFWSNSDCNPDREVGRFTVISSSIEIPFTIGTLDVSDDYVYKYTSSAGEISASLWNFTGRQFKDFLEKYNYVASTRTSKTYRIQSRGEVCTVVTGSRLSSKYSKILYHYSSSRRFSDPFYRGYEVAYSQSMKLHYSRSLAQTGYQYTEDSVTNRIRFTGCKLTGPAINEVSLETVDNLPVVEVREVNSTKFTV